MLIRSAARADSRGIIDLWDGAGMLAYTPDPQGDLDAVLAHDADLLLVAEDGGALLGTVTGTWDGRRGWLMRLAVAPPTRGRGLGRALCEELERRLVARGAAQVNLFVFGGNADALAFWDRQGYARSPPVELLSKRLGRQDAARPSSC
ncbi:hypothetical protein BH23ACT8_BH23ACT8_01270 [soil metagenome]